jgi:hypothetical protein
LYSGHDLAAFTKSAEEPKNLAEQLAKAGFRHIQSESKAMRPAPSVAVTGMK